MEAIEEATYRGVSVNVTVSFTVAQAVASAEAIERGLRRRDAEGLPTDRMGPVVTLSRSDRGLDADRGGPRSVIVDGCAPVGAWRVQARTDLLQRGFRVA
jgi:hypothetical protein